MPYSEDQQKSRVAGNVVTGVAVLVFIYFLFPHLYLLPMVIIYGKNTPPPPAVGEVLVVVFSPIGYLCERVPPYQWLIEMESDLTGIR